MAKAEKRPSQDFIKNRFSDENNQMFNICTFQELGRASFYITETFDMPVLYVCVLLPNCVL